MTIAEFVLGWLCVVVIVGMFVWIGIALHMAYTKMELMLAHLKNCSAVMTLAQFRQGGPWGKLVLVGSISGFVTFPNFYIKRGGVSAEDISNFPRSLKRKLIVLQWSVITLLLAMVALAAVVKLVRV